MQERRNRLGRVELNNSAQERKKSLLSPGALGSGPQAQSESEAAPERGWVRPQIKKTVLFPAPALSLEKGNPREGFVDPRAWGNGFPRLAALLAPPEPFPRKLVGMLVSARLFLDSWRCPTHGSKPPHASSPPPKQELMRLFPSARPGLSTGC